MKKFCSVISVFLVLMMLVGCFSACNKADAVETVQVEEAEEVAAVAAAEEPEPTEEPVEETAEPTAEDIEPFAVFNDLYVVEGTEDADTSSGVTVYDEDVIVASDADASQVDFSTIGDYNIVYNVSVSQKWYDAYVAAQDSLNVTEYVEYADTPVAEDLNGDMDVWGEILAYSGLGDGEAYTILSKYLEAPEDPETHTELLRNEDGAIVSATAEFTADGNTADVAFAHEVDTTLATTESIAIVPQYFLMLSSEVPAEFVEDEEVATAEESMDTEESTTDGTALDGEEIVAEEVVEDSDVDVEDPVYEVSATRTVHVIAAQDMTALLEDETSGVTAVSDTVAIILGTVPEADDTAEDVTNNADKKEETADVDTPESTETPTATEAPTITDAPVTTAKPTATPSPTAQTVAPTMKPIATEAPTETAKPSATTSPTAVPAATATPNTTTTSATTNTAAPAETAHVHNWVTETTTTPEQGHYETVTVVDQEAWTETLGAYAVCAACGATFPVVNGVSDIADHEIAECFSNYYISFDEVYHAGESHEETVWTVDTPATTTTTTKCSICGVIKG